MDIREKLFSMVRDHFCKPADFEITDTTEILSDLGADSLDVVELTMKLEEEFHLDIPDADAEVWSSVGDAVTYIQGRLGN